MPKIGSPVSRLKMNSSAIFVCCATAGIVRPPRRTSMRIGRRGQVVVPDVVVHELPEPLHLAGCRVERDQRIAIEVVAVIAAAPVVVADLLDRDEDDAALLVDR